MNKWRMTLFLGIHTDGPMPCLFGTFSLTIPLVTKCTKYGSAASGEWALIGFFLGTAPLGLWLPTNQPQYAYRMVRYYSSPCVESDGNRPIRCVGVLDSADI